MAPARSDAELLRPAMELAVELARQGRGADPPLLVPRRILPFLRFRHLPEAAIAVVRRVLDDDEDFRALVRDAASQEIGRPSWLFLDRPGGWEAELQELAIAAAAAAERTGESQTEATAARRLTLAEEARQRAEDEVSRLRVALGESKERLAVERRARRLADSERGRLRQQVVELEALVQTKVVEPEPADDRRDGGDTPTGPPPPPDTRDDGGTDLDHAALADALATGITAAEALAHALGLARRQLSPASPQPSLSSSGSRSGSDGPSSSLARHTVRVPTALPVGLFDDSVEAAEYLMRLVGVVVIVDGYNLTKLARGGLALPEQRQWLIDAAMELAARTEARLELVFDGVGDEEQAPAVLSRRAGVQVRFSPAGVEADDVVLDLVQDLPTAQPVVVASDDHRVRDGARRLGANVVASPQLLAVLRRSLG